MTEEKKNNRNRKEEITFYETFDDEIVMITDKASSISTENMGSPRLSYTPTPVIPGFYTLSDAFENARRRMRFEADLDEDEQTDLIPLETDDPGSPIHVAGAENSLVRPVSPGHFSIKKLERHPDLRAGKMRKSERTNPGRRINGSMDPNHSRHYIGAGELIEELTADEMVTEKSYWDKQMKQQMQTFDSILDETMKSLLNEADRSKVKSG